MRRHLSAAAGISFAAVLLALSSCSEPAGPGADPGEETGNGSGGGGSAPRVIALGEARVDSISSGDSARVYAYETVAADSLTAFLHAVQGTVTLTVRGPDGALLVTLTDSTRTGLLSDRGARLLPSAAAGRHTVTITTQPGARAVFQFQVAPSETKEITTIVLGDTVLGHLATEEEPDEFTFEAATGEEFIAYVRALAPGNVGAMMLSVFPAAWPRDAQMIAFAFSDTLPGELEGRSTGRFVIPAGATYVLRLSVDRGWSGAPGGYPRAYEFSLRRVVRTPETAAVALTAGDTLVTEAIDHVGDVDEFVLASPQGGSFNVFLARPGTGLPLLAEIVQPPHDVRTARADSAAQPLLANPTGRFDLAAGDSVRVRVLDDGSGYRGPYQIAALRIDPAPEAAQANVALGDSVAGEPLWPLGDIDEYVMQLTEMRAVNFVLRLEAPAAGGSAELRVVRASTNTVVGSAIALEGTPAAGTGTLALPADSYRLVVAGNSIRNGYSGAFSLVTLPIDSTPDTAAPALGVASRVDEALDPPGDVDTYTFSGVPREHFTVGFRPTGPVGQPNADVVVRHAASGTRVEGIPLDTAGVTRYDILEAGEYRVVVSPMNEGRDVTQVGPYRLTLDSLRTTPESRAAAVAVGDTVAGEGMNFVGDIDRFVLTAEPDAELTATLTGFRDSQVDLLLLDPATRAVVDSVVSAGWEQSAGRFRVPASGQLILSVLQRGPLYPAVAVGPYVITTSRIDRRPERVPQAIALDSVITGEEIEQSADVDEFLFEGTAGERVSVYFQTPLGARGMDGLTASLLAPGTGAVLGSVTSVNPTQNLSDQQTGAITLPVTGTYMVRVEGTLDWMSWGAFTFQVKQLP